MLSIASNGAAPRPALRQHQLWTIMSGMVHDIRQPLSVIEACADYLDLVLPPADSRSREQLELLQQQVGDANRILHEALLALYDGAADHAELKAVAAG